jgi:DNA-binding MarR family transcriptional regulator
MTKKERIWNAHSLYNLSRYIFLKIENEYNNIIELSGITLPQLRVLWILNSFSGISLKEIAKIGGWTPPTVTKMLKILMGKGIVEKEQYHNKKIYRLYLTELGEKYIMLNRQGHNEKFPLYKLIKEFNEGEIDCIISLFKTISINTNNEIILSYIDTVNDNGLKIDYSKFTQEEVTKFKKVVCFYNLLRTFILNVESEHRQYLIKFNLTYPQLRALWIIKAFSGLTSIELSEISFWAPSTANLVVNNLHGKGLIFKEKSQRKNSLYLYISDLGEKQIIDEFRENQDKLSIYSVENKVKLSELKNVNSLLKKMNFVLGNYKTEEYLERTFDMIQDKI